MKLVQYVTFLIIFSFFLVISCKIHNSVESSIFFQKKEPFQWEYMSEPYVLRPRAFAQAFLYKDNVVIFGGVGYKQPSSREQLFLVDGGILNLKKATWEYIPPPPVYDKRGELSFLSMQYKDFLIAIPLDVFENKIELYMYHLQKKQWTKRSFVKNFSFGPQYSDDWNLAKNPAKRTIEITKNMEARVWKDWIIFWGKNCESKELLLLDIGTNSFFIETYPPYLMAQCYTTAFHDKGFFVALGGWDSQGIATQHAGVFNVESKLWQQLDILTTPRALVSLLSVDKWLFIFGGYQTKQGGSLGDGLLLDLENIKSFHKLVGPSLVENCIEHQCRKWIEGNPLVALSQSGKIFLLGSHAKALDKRNRAALFDTRNFSWKKTASFPFRIQGGELVAIHDEHWIYWNENLCSQYRNYSVFLYSEKIDIWEHIYSPLESRIGASVVVGDNLFFVWGGRDCLQNNKLYGDGSMVRLKDFY